MPDSKPEQVSPEDVMGWSNRQSMAPSSREIPRPKDQRYAWPKDWEKRFDRDAQNFRDIPAVVDPNPEALLGIYSEPAYHDQPAVYFPNAEKSGVRVYWRFNHRLGRFQPGIYANFNYGKLQLIDKIPSEGDVVYEEVTTGTQSIRCYSDSATSAEFDEYNEEPDYIGLQFPFAIFTGEAQMSIEQKIGKRTVEVQYSGSKAEPHLRGIKYYIPGKYSVSLAFGNFMENGWNVKNMMKGKSKDVAPGEWNVTDSHPESSDKGQYEITRVENEEVVDRFFADKLLQYSGGINALQEDLFPDELMRDPQNPNPQLDTNWKDVSIPGITRFRWIAEQDDSRHSLTRFPIKKALENL